MTHPEQEQPKTATPADVEAVIADRLSTFQHEAAATRLAIQARADEQRRTNMWLTGFIAVTAVLVALVLVILVQNRTKTAESRQLIRANATLNQQIADCTSVGGECYKQAQARSQLTIAQLIESNKAIAKCARVTGTDADLDACVKRGLAEVFPTPTSSAPATPTPAPAR